MCAGRLTDYANRASHSHSHNAENVQTISLLVATLLLLPNDALQTIATSLYERILLTTFRTGINVLYSKKISQNSLFEFGTFCKNKIITSLLKLHTQTFSYVYTAVRQK